MNIDAKVLLLYEKQVDAGFEPLGQKRSGLPYYLRTSFAGAGLILNVVGN